MSTPSRPSQARSFRPRPEANDHRDRGRARRHRVQGRWRWGTIPVIGLVGGIGAGKSLAAASFARRGALVLDADAIGHTLLNQTPARQQVVRRFGPEILEVSEGKAVVDRRKLGALVFSDPTALRALEAILHPRMRKTFERAIARTARTQRHRAVVLDAAILFEAGWDDLCDLVVFVNAPFAARLQRLSAARGWTAEQLQAREAAQLPLEAKRRRADLVLLNDGSVEQLEEQIEALWSAQICRPSGSVVSRP